MKNPIFFVLAALTLATLSCSLVANNTDRSGTTSDSSESVSVDDPLPAELQAAFDELPPGDAASGKQIFTGAQPCHTCHIDLPVGPPFPGEPPLATLAEDRRPGYPADIYLYESIVDPSAYVVQGYQDSVMPQNLGGILSQQELADLVAYLMTMQ